MRRTLYGKLALVLVVLLSGLGILYGALNLSSNKLFLQELNQRFNRDLARQLLVQKNMMKGSWLSEQQIKELFSHYMHINPAIEIYLLDTQGKILAFEAPQMKIKRDHVDLEPIKRFLGGDMQYPILGDDPRSLTREKVFSAAAYPFEGETRQYLYVVLSGEDYDTIYELLGHSYFTRVSLAAIAATVVVGLLIGLYVFNLLTHRLARLTRVMEDFRTSDFRRYQPYDARHQRGTADEIDTVGHTFDLMAERMVQQLRALEEKDTLRRNLVANVSHDLRTPLASLRGYLETLKLKGGEFNDERRDRYLDIALGQSERLTELVSELFELATLDARETQPEWEPLAIGELLYDVAQKFQLRAEERHIAIRVDLNDEPPLVRADTGMINRVLENLVANAIDHTPDGGAITLAVTTQGSMARIAVRNSGPCIAPEQLPYLFNRFYQAPEKRGGGGAGLGLAIAHRVIELHEGTIAVTSENDLTTFSFTLPLWRQ